jgi:hypothetical protein
VYRLLATVIFAYAVLAAAQWGEETRWLHRSPGKLRCGNVVSDPYMLLVNVVAPLAAVANAALIRRGVRTRWWLSYTIVATLTFLATAACLAYEGYLLKSEYGFQLGDVWWLPVL